MIFKQIESGGDRNYAYFIACKKTAQAALIDPSPDPFKVINAIQSEIKIGKIIFKYIINTHSHCDHSAGNDHFRNYEKSRKAEFINCEPGLKVKDGEVLKLGEVELVFIHTPGHTPDSICIKAQEKLITGDTLFVGKVGGTYSREEALAEFESLKKIMMLPPGTEVWPGHNYGVETSSTIGFELKNNPFVERLKDFNEFLWLKKNWAQYKQEHGIK